MRMPPEARNRPSFGIEEIEKDEWLESLAVVRWTHQAGDGSVTVAVCPMHDLT
jgi:hypothetical protein